MKLNIPLLLLALSCGAAATVAIAAIPASTPVTNDPFWANVHWDDDDDSAPKRALVPMPVPNADAIRRAGMVVVHEVERDDGLIEVEGFDSNGRELDIKMDPEGKNVISVRHDD